VSLVNAESKSVDAALDQIPDAVMTSCEVCKASGWQWYAGSGFQPSAKSLHRKLLD